MESPQNNKDAQRALRPGGYRRSRWIRSLWTAFIETAHLGSHEALDGREPRVRDVQGRLVLFGHELGLEVDAGEYVPGVVQCRGDLAVVERHVRVACRDGLLLLD